MKSARVIASVLMYAQWSENEDERKRDISFWNELPETVLRKTFEYKGDLVTVFIDWRKMSKGIDRLGEVLFSSEPQKKHTMQQLKGQVRIPATVDFVFSESSEQSDVKQRNAAESVLEYCLHSFFLVSNLSIPGICDFYRAEIKIKGDQRRFAVKSYINISSYAFERTGDTECPDWMRSQVLPVSDVEEWFSKIAMGGELRQRAESPIEKALFSILHYCRLDFEVTSIIWVVHALEAMFSTRVGDAKRALLEKIAFTLDLADRDKKSLKRNINGVYEGRDKLVHGGFATYSPLMNEHIDSEIWVHVSDLVDQGQVGFQILIACVQSLIAKRFYSVKAEEILSFKC